jgi:hypothetical protein
MLLGVTDTMCVMLLCAAGGLIKIWSKSAWRTAAVAGNHACVCTYKHGRTLTVAEWQPSPVWAECRCRAAFTRWVWKMQVLLTEH